MRHPACVFASITVLGFMMHGPHAARADEKLDAAWKALAGSWRVESAKADNQDIPMKGAVYTLGKEKSSMTMGAETADMKCAIDVSASPIKINLAPVGAKKDGVETMQGIYKIDGGTLMICWAVGTEEGKRRQAGDNSPAEEPKLIPGKRPTKFTTDDAMLMTLVRVGPAAEHPVPEKPQEPAAKEARAWQDTSGRKLEAALVEVKEDKVTLRRTSDGKILTIPLAKLSQADQEYVKQAAAAKPDPIKPAKAKPETATPETAKPETAKPRAPKVALKAPKAPQPAAKFSTQELPIADDKRKEFNKQYEGKWVEVTGWVNGIGVNWQDPKAKPSASLAGLKDDKKPYHIKNIDFNRSLSGVFLHDLPWLHFSCGSEVTLRGIMSAKGHLDDARIISVKGEPVECFSPDELVAVYDKSPEDFDKLARERDFIVRGQIVDYVYTDPLSMVPCMRAADGSGVRLFLVNRVALFGGATRGEWWKDVRLNEEVAVYSAPGQIGRAGQREFLIFGLTDCTRFPLEGLPKSPPVKRSAKHAATTEKPAKVPAGKARLPKSVTNSIGMKLNLIPAGECIAGTPENFIGHFDYEHPRRVRITQPFYMGVYEVTQAEYGQVMGGTNAGGRAKDNNRMPMSGLRWVDAEEFCKKLSEKEGKTYRLPTEGEWEYACRAGTKTLFHYGDSLSAAQANFNGEQSFNGPKGPRSKGVVAVGSYRPNAFGLYDMHGNVAEWCADFYDKQFRMTEAAEDPQGPPAGDARISKGGDWGSSAINCSSARFGGDGPLNISDSRGLRVVLEVPHVEDKQQPLAAGAIKPIKVPKATDAELEQYVTELRTAGNLKFNKYREQIPSTVAMLSKENGFRANLGTLSRVTGLSELHFEKCDRLAPKDFGLLVNFNGIQYLYFKDCAFTDGAVPLLAEIATLQTLHIEKTRLTEKGLATLPPGLKTLAIHRTQLGPGGFKNLPVLPNLQTLVMEDSNIDDEGLAGLGKQPALETIQIMRGKFTDQGLAHLKTMPKLNNLWLRECPGITDAGLAHLQAIPKLRFLNLTGSKNVTPDGLKALKQKRPDVGLP